MGESEDTGSEKPLFYDVDKFKNIVNAQHATAPLRGPKLILARSRSALDSFNGLLSTLFFVAIVFAAPFVVVVGAVYGLVSFLISFLGVIGGLSYYANRKVGKTVQFVDGNLSLKILAQLAACSLVLAGTYVLFVVVLKHKFS